jgi:hypothetical protein
LVLSISLTGIDLTEESVNDFECEHAQVMTGDLLSTTGGLNYRVNLLVEVREKSRAKTPFLQIFRAQRGKRFS